MLSYRRYPLDSSLVFLFFFPCWRCFFVALGCMYCGSCLGNERADYRKRMLCDGLLSRLQLPPPKHTTPPSVLTFLYNLSLYTYTRINNHHGCKSFKGFGYVSPLNTAPRQTNVVLGKMFGNKEMRLLMLGLDAAGKTSTYPRFSSWLGMF